MESKSHQAQAPQPWPSFRLHTFWISQLILPSFVQLPSRMNLTPQEFLLSGLAFNSFHPPSLNDLHTLLWIPKLPPAPEIFPPGTLVSLPHCYILAHGWWSLWMKRPQVQTLSLLSSSFHVSARNVAPPLRDSMQPSLTCTNIYGTKYVLHIYLISCL